MRTCCHSPVWHGNEISQEGYDQLQQQLLLPGQRLRKLAQWLADKCSDHSQSILGQKGCLDILHVGDLHHGGFCQTRHR